VYEEWSGETLDISFTDPSAARVTGWAEDRADAR
jgi:hypothetical protein